MGMFKKQFGPRETNGWIESKKGNLCRCFQSNISAEWDDPRFSWVTIFEKNEKFAWVCDDVFSQKFDNSNAAQADADKMIDEVKEGGSVAEYAERTRPLIETFVSAKGNLCMRYIGKGGATVIASVFESENDTGYGWKWVDDGKFSDDLFCSQEEAEEDLSRYLMDCRVSERK